MLRLTEADVGKKVITGTPIDPEMAWEEYPDEVATVVSVHLLDHHDEEPGDADWAHVQLDPEFRTTENPEGIVSVPFCCILRFVD